ncbi:hypothetical protein [Paludisphaera rhizosphaerae]|uniref:hypothetical protein n=1 Tax=Paludisphaera rhizosphaerae TaxID=2711216 RepID=UPI0013ED2AA1|nr:hypothetical protein [Paludisphaera rhizosphaerae]
MSLASEFSAPVNTTTRNAQFSSANASSSNGSSVVVWTDTFSSTDHDIRAQRFNAAGQKVGSEIVVSFSSLDEGSPAVAMDAGGNFVVTWMQTVGSDTNVVAQRFSAAGTPVGGIVQVGAGTFREHNPSIAMDARGDFVVAYTRDTNYVGDNTPDVFAKLYNSSNQLLNVINVAVTASADDRASVAMTPDGRFNVAWEHTYSTNDHDIYMNRYNASGGLLGTNFIDTSTAFESRPSVSMDDAGNSVVAWQRQTFGNNDILARRVSSTGVMSSTLSIAATSFSEESPKVALKRSGGAFVVVYNGFDQTSEHVRVAEVSSSNNITRYDAGIRSDASVSINSVGQYVVTYTSNDGGDLNIRRRLGHL